MFHCMFMNSNRLDITITDRQKSFTNTKIHQTKKTEQNVEHTVGTVHFITLLLI